MPGVVDADTHIAEPVQMWDHLDSDFYARRPVVVQIPDDTWYGNSDHMWVIDGNLFPRAAGKAGNRLVTPTSQSGVAGRPDVKARELTDLPYRFLEMAEMQVDTQVIYPTLFLAFLTNDPHMEVALAKAYNRFLAEVWAKSEGRIRWVMIPPLRNIDATISEMRFAKDNGACGVFFRGIEKDMTLDDPYFFPVYEEAASLGLSIAVHQGQGAPALNALIDLSRSHTFTHGRFPPVSAFRNLVANRVPAQFPGLRFGFIESGASWIPWVLHQLKGTMRGVPDDFLGPKLFDEYNLFVSYELEEDLPYLLRFTGDDHMVVGTDYGHHAPGSINRLDSDPSAQTHMVENLRSRDEHSSEVIEKILKDNPSALYGVS